MERVVLTGLKRTRLFADGADIETIVTLSSDPLIAGFTTNPTLMRGVGLSHYESFARALLEKVPGHPVSLAVCADEPGEIERQARVMSRWGPNVVVKVPVTTSTGEDMTPVAGELSRSGVKVNVTAVFTVEQAQRACRAVDGGSPSYISVFAGRIADAGIDPVPVVAEVVRVADSCSGPQVIWASPREVLNVLQADSVGCHVITLTPDLLGKLSIIGKDLEQYSRETVLMFYRDAQASGLAP